MHKGEAMPLAHEDEVMANAIVTITTKSFGCLGVVDSDGRLVGIITDGDLRRHMGPKLLTAKTSAIMTLGPVTATSGMLASAALELLNSGKRTVLFVVENGRPIGILHLHDLLRAGVA